MADDSGSSGGAQIPGNDSYGEWTFEQAVQALTGEGADLHAAAKATWFTFGTGSGGGDISYHAWDEYFYNVTINQAAITQWAQAVSTMNEVMYGIGSARRGSMSQQSVIDLAQTIRDFGSWAQDGADGMNGWAGRLDSDDKAFRGKAAYLIQWRLKTTGDGLTDTYEQVNSRHGQAIGDAVMEAADELGRFNGAMYKAWDSAYYGESMPNWIEGYIGKVVSSIHSYVLASGLQVGTDNYVLDDFDDVDAAKTYIRSMLQAYPDGDLTSAAGWQKLSDNVTNFAVGMLKALLDGTAQDGIGKLASAYTLATSALIPITPPPAQTAPSVVTSPPDGSGGGSVPPPDGSGGGSVPPPDGSGGGSVPPPGGSGDGSVPPPDGSIASASVPPPDGSADGSVPPPGDGSVNSGLPSPDGSVATGGVPTDGGFGDTGVTPPAGGVGNGDVPSPDGGFGTTDAPSDVPPANGGASGFVPSLAAPTGGGTGAGSGSDSGKNPPSADGAFDENAAGNGVITPADGGVGGDGLGDASVPDGSSQSKTAVPPGAGQSDVALPAGGADGGVGVGAGSGAGAGAGGGQSNAVVPPGGADAGGGAGTGAGFGSGAGGGQSNAVVPPGGADAGGGAGTGAGTGAGSGSGAGGGQSRAVVPPGGAGSGLGSSTGGGPGGFGSDPGKGFGSGAGLGDLGGGLGDGKNVGGLGGGLGGAGGGLGGAGGGVGGAGGLGRGGGSGTGGLGGGFGSGGPGGAPSQLSGGSPNVNGAPGSSGGAMGGVPFFPPMMGGAGAAGGERPQERERQTWLSEDEEIWGTRAEVGSGVIGRLGEEELEAEDLPMDAPNRRPRRADAPRRPRPGEQREREAAASAEEASGSA